MKIRFEPQSQFIVVHERHIKALVDAIQPPDFDGALVVTQPLRDSPVEIALVGDGHPPLKSTLLASEYYGEDGKRHLRDTLMGLFETALKEWDAAHSERIDAANQKATKATATFLPRWWVRALVGAE